MSAKTVRQYELRDGDGSSLVCWLEHHKLAVGQTLTLVELPGRLWLVVNRYHETIDKQALHQPWKVGGL